MSESKSYDELCAEAVGEAENRLLEHFKIHGGEVWTIGSGCEQCRQPVDDVNALKKCSVCQAALFCNGDCLKDAWRRHKNECAVIAALRKHHDTQAPDHAGDVVLPLLKKLGWSSEDVKSCAEPKVVGVATSLQLSEASLPGWFCTVDFDMETKECQKQLMDVALTLYALLRDDESWTRDKDSFPRSSYTHVESIHHSNASQPMFEKQLLALNGHLLLLSTWLQHPEPPATQSIPLEDRGFYGVIDSILQITSIRDAIDSFMDAR